MRFVASLVIAATVGSLAFAARPTFLNTTAAETLLNVDPSFMWQWTLAERTYSTEAALQSAGLFYGQYASMETYRFAGNGGNATAADHELLLESSATTAAEAMGLTLSRYTGSTADQAAFSTWLKAELDAGRPVMLGMFKLINETVGGYGDYDHVALAVGYTANATFPNLATLTILDFFADTPRVLEPASLFKTRDEWRTSNLNPSRPYDFALPVSGWEALAVTVRDTNTDAPSQSGRVQANVTMFREPRWPIGEAVQNITVDVSVTGLIADRFYRLIRFDSNLTIPSADYLSSSSIAWTFEFRADGSGSREFPELHFLDSDATVAYRVVIVNAPAATPAPLVEISRDAACLNDGPGIYSMDSSAVECVPLRQCRTRLCSCLGVGDGNRCWLRSLEPCSRYSMCFALATHCIESVANSSADVEDCGGLHSAYRASLPGATPSYSNNDRVYRESSLGRQCYSWTCQAYRSYFPNAERCSIDYDAVCDLPDDVHYRLEMRLADVDVPAMVDYHVNRENFAAATKTDMDTLLTSTNAGRNTVTVLSVNGFSDRLYIDVRIEQTTEFPNVTLFVATVSTQGTGVLTRLNTAVQAAGAAGSVTVVSFAAQGTPEERTGLGGLLDGCDNTCVIAVSVAAIVVIAATMCAIFCIRYLCCDRSDDAGASSMSAAVRKVMDKQKQREIARKNDAEDAEEAAKTNEPTEL